MNMNIKTAQHLQSICKHARRDVQAGITLKSTRDYLHYQLVTRPTTEGLEVEEDTCHDMYCFLYTRKTKAAFIQECLIVEDAMQGWIAKWKAEKKAQEKGVVTISVKKVDDEYQVYTSNNPAATYFTNDKADARDTAASMMVDASNQGYDVRFSSKTISKLPAPLAVHICDDSDANPPAVPVDLPEDIETIKEGDSVYYRDIITGDRHLDRVAYLYTSVMDNPCASLRSGLSITLDRLTKAKRL